LGIFLLLFSSCVSSVNVAVPIKQAPLLDIPQKASISIIPFVKAEDSDTALPDFDTILNTVWKKKSWDKLNEITLLNSFEKSIASVFEDNKTYSVQDFTDISNEITEPDLAALKEKLGDSYVIYSEIISMKTQVDDLSYENKKGTISNYFETRIMLKVHAYIYDSTSSQLIYDKIYTKEDKGNEENYTSAQELAKTLSRAAFTEIAQDLEAQLAPHYISIERTLLNATPDNEIMKNGRILVRRGNYADAQALYKDLYDSTKSLEAGYNAAIMMELQKKYDDALTLLTELDSLYDSPEVKKELEVLSGLFK